MAQLQSFHYISNTTTASHTIPLSQPATAGSKLFLFTASNAITTISGFTKLANSLSGLDVSAWVKTAAGGETSITATLSVGADCFASGWEFPNLGSPESIVTDQDTNNWAGDGTYLFVGDFNPTQNCVFVSIFADNGGRSPLPNGAEYMTSYDAPLNNANVVLGNTSGAFNLAASSSMAATVTAGSTIHSKATNTGGIVIGGTSQGIVMTIGQGITPISVSTPTTLTATVGDTVQLVATATNGSGIQTWTWTQLSGITTTITNATQATAEIIFTAPGSYSFQITVSDDTGNATASVTVTVSNPPATRFLLDANGTWVPLTTTLIV